MKSSSVSRAYLDTTANTSTEAPAASVTASPPDDLAVGTGPSLGDLLLLPSEPVDHDFAILDDHPDFPGVTDVFEGIAGYHDYVS